MSNDPTCLVLEDEKPLADAILDKLRKQGCNVLVARSVDSALLIMKKLHRLDVIWLDHYLIGDKTGDEFIEIIHKKKIYRDVPIYVVSNTASEDKIKKYMDLGVKKYYTKSDFKIGRIVKDIKKEITLEI